MIQENYVSFELAKLLKEKGFSQEGYFAVYNAEEELVIPPLAQLDDMVICETPTLYLAAKLLREGKDVHIDILSDTDCPEWTGEYEYIYDISYNDNGELGGIRCDQFKTYEQALSARIDKALELI